MGLFDRLLGSRSDSQKLAGSSSDAKPAKEKETFYLDPDASSSLGNVDYMRRSNTIRHTFPGNADSPGGKEMVQTVASMDASLEKMTPGLAGTSTDQNVKVNLTGGVPKPVKKTFAQQISSAVLEKRMKGAAVKGTNEPAATSEKPREEAAAARPAASLQGAKPGDTDAFRSWARDLNA
jgi:hypothetical protein